MHKLLLNWDSSAEASWMSQVGHCDFPDHFDLNLPVPQFPVWSWCDEVKCRRYSMVPTKHQQISDEHQTHKKLIMPYLSRGWLGSQEGGTGPCWMRSVKGRGLSIIHALSHPQCIPGTGYTGNLNSSWFLCAWLSWMLLLALSSAFFCFALPKGLRDWRFISSRSSCPGLTCPTQQRIKNSHGCQIRIRRVL